MGIIKQGILGGFSGKVGSVVGTSWKGRAVMKAMPLSVANPRTTGQVNQRAKFKASVNLAKALLGGSISILDNPFAGSVSGYNRFVGRNASYFDNGGHILFSSLKISEGALGKVVVSGSGTLNIAREVINVDLVSEASPYNLDNDQVVAVVISQKNDEVLNSGSIIGTRVATNANLELSRPLAAGELVHIYISTIRADKKYVSNSSYTSLSFA